MQLIRYNRFGGLIRRAAVLAAIAFSMLTFAAAGPAHAQPADGLSKGCPVEDTHGNTTYVPIGTHIGILVCGTDGYWHIGWLIDG